MFFDDESQVIALASVSLTQQDWLARINQVYPLSATPEDMASFWTEVTTLLLKTGYPVQLVWSYERAILDFQQIDRAFEAYAFSVNYGLCLDQLSLHRQAVTELRQALRLLDRTWTPNWPASIPALKAINKHNLATAYLHMGKPQLAITYNKAALSLKRALQDEVGQISVLIGLANAHRDQGLYRQATDFYQQALALAEEHSEKQVEAKCALGLGNLNLTFTNVKLAISWYQRAVTLCEENDFWEDLPMAYVSLGNAYHQLAMLDEPSPKAMPPSANPTQLLQAMGFYKKALAATSNADPLAMADIWLKCGHLAIDLGSVQAAEQSYQIALRLINQSGNYEATFETMISLGNLALQQLDYSKALDWYQQALRFARVNHHQEHESIANADVGYAYLEQGNWAQAIPFLEASIQLSERLGHNLFVDTQKIGYFSSTQADYEALIQAYLRIGLPERALYYVEKSKSKALLDLLGTGEIPIQRELVDSVVFKREKSCRQAIRKRMLAGVDSPEITPLKKKLNRLYQQLASVAPEYVSVRRGDVLSFDALQAWLAA